MPALEHAFTDLGPDHLYLDTDILINVLVSTQPHHSRCIDFLRRLQVGARTTLYLSSLTWLELTHVVTRPSFRDVLAVDIQHLFQFSRWDRPSVRRAYIDALLGDVETVLEQFTWIELPVTPAIRRRATRFMAEYRLGSHDAAHLASAAQAGVADVASLDAAFRRVDDLDLWNDLIHQS